MGFLANGDDDMDEDLALDDAEMFSYMLDDVLDNIENLDEITLDSEALQMFRVRSRKHE